MIAANENDAVAIGKLRRQGRPAAAVSYDPGYGIRVAGEDAPRDSAAAAAWCRSAGWLRVKTAAKTHPSAAVRAFLKAWRIKP